MLPYKLAAPLTDKLVRRVAEVPTVEPKVKAPVLVTVKADAPVIAPLSVNAPVLLMSVSAAKVIAPA